MTEELCSKYCDLLMIWFDVGADDPKRDGPEVEPIINRLHPNVFSITMWREPIFAGVVSKVKL